MTKSAFFWQKKSPVSEVSVNKDSPALVLVFPQELSFTICKGFRNTDTQMSHVILTLCPAAHNLLPDIYTVAPVGGGRSLYLRPPRPRLRLWAPHVPTLPENSYLPALLNISPTPMETDQSSKRLTAEMKVQQEPPKDKLDFLHLCYSE